MLPSWKGVAQVTRLEAYAVTGESVWLEWLKDHGPVVLRDRLYRPEIEITAREGAELVKMPGPSRVTCRTGSDINVPDSAVLCEGRNDEAPPTNQGHRLAPLQRDGTLRIREKNSLNFSTVADVDPGTLEPAA